MAVTSRLSLPLIEQGQQGGVTLVDQAFQLIDAGAGLLAAANVFTQTNTFSGTLAHTGSLLGFYSATPIAQPANTVDLRTGLSNLGLRAAGGNTPLDLGGGTFLCGSASVTLLSGKGVPLKLNGLVYTFPTNADQTLNSTEASSPFIDIQDGIISAPRSIFVPLGTGNLFLVRNRQTTHTVTIIGASGAGCPIPAGRQALLVATAANVTFAGQPVVPTTGAP